MDTSRFHTGRLAGQRWLVHSGHPQTGGWLSPGARSGQEGEPRSTAALRHHRSVFHNSHIRPDRDVIHELDETLPCGHTPDSALEDYSLNSRPFPLEIFSLAPDGIVPGVPVRCRNRLSLTGRIQGGETEFLTF